jgi:hypothetical protein
MDPLTRFNSGGRRAAATARGGATPNSVTVRAWPPTAPADDDEEWDALIARAKMRAAAAPRAVARPQPAPLREVPPELQVTPPPEPLRQPPMASMGQLHAQRIRTAEEVRAKLDVIVRGSARRPRR